MSYQGRRDQGRLPSSGYAQIHLDTFEISVGVKSS